MTTAQVQDLADLKAYAEKLVRTNLFLSGKDRELWKSLIPKMTEENLGELIQAFEDNKEDLKKALMEHFQNDKEGKLIEKIKAYKKEAIKGMASSVHASEAEKAEEDLSSELSNI